MKKSKGGDATGVERGARGYGELSKADKEFLAPGFDRRRQQAERAVGMYATADNPQVVK
jgi:hypothetical protein